MTIPRAHLTFVATRAIAATAIAVAASLAAATTPLVAQDVQLSVAGGWYNPGGEDFDDTDAGAGYDAVVRFGLSDRLQLGFGTQWNIHGVGFTDDRYDVVSVFAEPRLSLSDASGSAIPFVAGRIAWARQSIRIGSVSRAATGLGLGGLAGVAFPLSSAVELETAVTAYYLSFSDFDVAGTTLAGSESSGNAFGLRVALNWRR